LLALLQCCLSDFKHKVVIHLIRVFDLLPTMFFIILVWGRRASSDG
jgi:hypothetical protein